MRLRGRVYLDKGADLVYPWFFTVEHVPRREDPYEYGSLATLAEAADAARRIIRDAGPALTPVPGATPVYDEDGNEVVTVATCGHCGRSWNDAAISAVTPAPSARCPFEYDHV